MNSISKEEPEPEENDDLGFSFDSKSLKQVIFETKVIHKKELNFFMTFTTLVKAFIGGACLYMPRTFINGGWLFSSVVLLMSATITCYCGLLLLKVSK